MSHQLILEELNPLSITKENVGLFVTYWKDKVECLYAIDIAELIGKALVKYLFIAADNIIYLITNSHLYLNKEKQLTEIDYRKICGALAYNDNLLNLAIYHNANDKTFQFLLKYGNPYIKSPKGLRPADSLYNRLPASSRRLQLVANTHGLIGIKEEWRLPRDLDLTQVFFAGMAYSHTALPQRLQHINNLIDFRVLLDSIIRDNTNEKLKKLINMRLRLMQFSILAETEIDRSILHDLQPYIEVLNVKLTELEQNQRIIYTEASNLKNLQKSQRAECKAQNRPLNQAPLVLINFNEIEEVLDPNKYHYAPLINLQTECEFNIALDFSINEEKSNKVQPKAEINNQAKIATINNEAEIQLLCPVKLTYTDFLAQLKVDEETIQTLLNQLQPNLVRKFLRIIEKTALIGTIATSGLAVGNYSIEAIMAIYYALPIQTCVAHNPNNPVTESYTQIIHGDEYYNNIGKCIEPIINRKTELSSNLEMLGDVAEDEAIGFASCITICAATWLILRGINNHQQRKVDQKINTQLPLDYANQLKKESRGVILSPRYLDNPEIVLRFALEVIQAKRNQVLPSVGQCFSVGVSVTDVASTLYSKSARNAPAEDTPLNKDQNSNVNTHTNIHR